VITPSKGVRLSVDVGTVRVGVARCDRDQIMATPVATLSGEDTAIEEIIALADEYSAELIYVGKPISLNQGHTASTDMAIAFAQHLASTAPIPVHLVDERLTTVSAQTQLHVSGKSTKQSKNVIDQIAAVVLLDHAMAIEKSTGNLAGELVNPQESA
jgi:putative Holliday junction resolvase